jgi:hypothetical protein
VFAARSNPLFVHSNLLSSLPDFFAPTTTPDHGPVCHSILDPHYTMFADICGVIPQARYSLPNFLGHVDRWQIAQALSVFLGPSNPSANNPACTRSLRLLVCPLLFPPCPGRREASPALPCQSFCRGLCRTLILSLSHPYSIVVAVQTQCAAPGMEMIPCDFLPVHSDICPGQ